MCKTGKICQVGLHSWGQDKRKARSCSSCGSTHHHHITSMWRRCWWLSLFARFWIMRQSGNLIKSGWTVHHHITHVNIMSSLLTTHCQQNVGSCESSSWTFILRNLGLKTWNFMPKFRNYSCQAVKVQELLTLSLLLPRNRAKTTRFCGEHLIPTQDSQKTNKSSEPGRAPSFPTSPTGPTVL